MYLDIGKVTVKGRVYSRCLLRESYREQGKVKHRTIANLSKCSDEEIAAMKFAFEHKHDLDGLKKHATAIEPYTTCQGASIGAVAILYGLAHKLGLADALGHHRQGRLALWQVLARVIDQGSRLSAVRLATSHACCDLLGLDAFNEDHLYSNLAWLAENQRAIENRLFQTIHPDKKPPLFLYDVTSSYLEGQKNALGAFGYNRDGKRGKKQIVIGLLCDGGGVPLAIEVFAGNTLDPQTLSSQIHKVVTKFGGGEVTFVGDRGMIKGPQIAELTKQGFHYITAITKPQIRTLLNNGILQMNLFDQTLGEVCDESVRYVLRRNPRRAQEMLASWVTIKAIPGERKVQLHLDASQRQEEAKLDGCYVLKTDLTPAQIDKEGVHARYKDLAHVEQAFRTSKTVELEMRPLHVRKAESTRGHALVVMLAYRMVKELARCWVDLDLTVGEGIKQLSTLCVTEIKNGNKVLCSTIPQPRAELAEIIACTGIALPEVLKRQGANVATKKKLTSKRLKR